MENKIQKLRIIEAPKELQLNNEELLDFLGGANCQTFDVVNGCHTSNNGACRDGSGASLFCNLYT